MDSDNLVVSFENSFCNEVAEFTGEIVEIVEFGIDLGLENEALKDPDHDWRVVLDGPLRGRTFQRHDVGKWVLVSENDGFA